MQGAPEERGARRGLFKAFCAGAGAGMTENQARRFAAEAAGKDSRAGRETACLGRGGMRFETAGALAGKERGGKL